MTNPDIHPNEPGFNPAYRRTPPWDICRPQINYIRPAQFAINAMPVHKDRAWLASITRT